MSTATLRRASRVVLIGAPLVLIVLGVVSRIGGWTGEHPSTGQISVKSSTIDDGASVNERRNRFPVTVRRPSGPPLIELPQPDPLGRVGSATCSTCHSLRQANLENRKPSDLREFHQDMPLSHGELACYACHNPQDSDTLRLADGSAVEYTDVMNLCAQCHGVQARYYARGLHGGMAGYWDLSRGGRVRNNCIDCHDPHVPKFPTMRPTFKTRDRFLVPSPDDLQLHAKDTH